MKRQKYGIFLAVSVLALSALACDLGGAASPTQAPAATATLATTQPGQAPTTAPGAATAAPTQAGNAAPTTAAPPSGDPLDIIGRALRAELSAKSVRRHTVGTDGDTKYENTLEYVAPDYLHQIVGNNEFIYIRGVGTWRKKTSDATWIAAGLGSSEQVFAGRDPAIMDGYMKSIVVDQVKFVGPQLLDKRPTFEYQYLVHLDPSTNTVADLTNKLWVGVADGLPYRLETDYDSVLHAGAKVHSVIVIEYPTDITVIRPKP